MVLQKTLICLTLGSVVTTGVLQTTYPTNYANKLSLVSKAQSNSLGRYEPFNPNVFERSAADGNGNYYAYYDKSAFNDPSGAQGETYGYILDLSMQQEIYLGYVYNWITSLPVKLQFAYGYMLSYLTDDPAFATPYSGEWTFTGDLLQDADSDALDSITQSIAMDPIDANAFIQNAIIQNQTVCFYFFSDIIFDGFERLHYAGLVIGNDQTGATLATKWYPGKPH